MPAFSIRTKITLCFLVFVMLMSGVFALSSYLRIIKAMHVEIEKHGTEVAKILSQTTAPYIYDSDYVTVLDIVHKLIVNSDIQGFSIIDSLGKSWMNINPSSVAILVDDPFYRAVIEDAKVSLRRITRDGQSLMEFVSPITALGKVTYLLRIEMSLGRVQQEAAQRIQENIAISLAMIAIAVMLAVVLARMLTAPLNELVKGTKEISEGNLSHRIAVRATDETGALSKSFNRMAASLEHELSVRKIAERRLKGHSDRLEDVVSERTALLTDTNVKLSEEIENHKRTEAALVENKERYRRFSEVTLDGIVFLDEDGIVDINDSFTEMFGYPLQELVGKDLLQIIGLSENIDTLRASLLSDIGKNIETSGKKSDGQVLPIELHRRSLESNGTTLTVYFIRDITKRKQLEAQLQQAQRMEGIGRLAAGIAHDLNNILSGIVTLPQLLLMDLPENSPLKGPLELIQKSGDNAAVIVQDMLTLAKSGLNIRKVINPQELVMDYIMSPESMKLKQTHPGIRIQLDFEENISNIKCSPVHLAKVLMNLVYNAADAIEGEGEILISLKNVYIDQPLRSYEAISEGDYVCFSVKDSGTGIPRENIPLVFEPFYTKKMLGRSGTGLGMAIVWNTVKDHKGYIDITSNVDIGTEINVYIPITRDILEQKVEVPGLQSLQGRGETILVVDDIKEQREIAGTILEKLNYQVRLVTGGVDAVEYLQQHSVDLILLDMIMDPGIDGLETCRRIFSTHPKAKVVIASGYAENDMVKSSLELGALMYIKKPYSIVALGSVIKNAFTGP